MGDTYKIIRCFAKANTPAEVRRTGLTLEEAKAHCHRPDTKKDGVFYDAWTKETTPQHSEA